MAHGNLYADADLLHHGKRLFDDYMAELEENNDLTRARYDAEVYKERLRQILIKRYEIVPPATKPPWA